MNGADAVDLVFQSTAFPGIRRGLDGAYTVKLSAAATLVNAVQDAICAFVNGNGNGRGLPHGRRWRLRPSTSGRT
jgi:hypothetical protein